MTAEPITTIAQAEQESQTALAFRCSNTPAPDSLRELVQRLATFEREDAESEGRSR